jgi:NAD(P)-dependent dehydrogenase (short-subunit alcohol dehydrogenase family)
MTGDLSGRRAVVTGATFSTTSMGYAIAKALAEAGASVVLNGRSEHHVNAAEAHLRGQVPAASVTTVAADVATTSGVDRIIADVPDADILVCNAGTPEPKEFFEITDGDWEQQFHLHVMAGVRLARHYAQGMRERKWGRILFNASDTGAFALGEMVHYGTTKSALLGLSRGLAESLRSSGVTVNAFLPGPTRERPDDALTPDGSDGSAEEFTRQEAEIFAGLPSLLERFISPTEIAAVVAFLASPEASAVTGTAVRIDGGIVRSIL